MSTPHKPFKPIPLKAPVRDRVIALNELGDSVDRLHGCIEAGFEAVAEKQEEITAALKIGPHHNGQKTFSTLLRPSGWTIAGVIIAGLIAMPLAAKIINAAWGAVTKVLLK